LEAVKKVSKTCPTWYICTFVVKGACTCIFCFHQTPWNLVLSICWVLLCIMLEEHHVIYLWKHWYRTICKWISTVLNLYKNLEMHCGSLQLLALTSLSMTRLLRCVFYFCSCRSFQHFAHNLCLSNCTTRSLPCFNETALSNCFPWKLMQELSNHRSQLSQPNWKD